ncbi:VQ motif-containing protein 1-like [Neltuma alba]|uniref:VQ motif-containing protein 1-like n=1 Tax=Neltuma alba TaxID=207710 RepID=UPI0010A54210|nr:VQ motif-containing protein 1-like [Prosopis alba]
MMSAGRGYSKKPVKIVIISTQYVQTDAGSFKSVVQKLTGKDSHHHHHHVEEEPPPPPPPPSRKEDSILLEPKAHQSHHEVSGGGSSRVFIRDVSFKEFDRMFREMPPIHEIWSGYNQ